MSNKNPLPPSGDEAVVSVYAELRRLASFYLRQERKGHTLQPTALVHEVYLRLSRDVQWRDKSHFFSVAAPLMRQILVDYSRRRRAAKRGGDAQRVSIDHAVLPLVQRADDIVALDEALEELAAIDLHQARIVELRFFSGLSIEETAEVVQVSPSTVKRDWNVAKAWLARALSAKNPHEDG
jgi:RNA polymerase sigma factor (TIGR02999 family)